jgi:hypothetical protein
MKSSTIILSVGLVIAFSLGRVSSNEVQDGQEAGLREEVKQLREQVDFLMTEHRLDAQDVEALSQRVKDAQLVQTRMQVLFNVGAQRASGEQLHQSNAELRLAQGRLDFAERRYESAIDHLDAAIAAAKQARNILNSKLDAGTVTLDFLVAAQQAVVDIQLERNRMQRKLKFLDK